MTVTGLTILSDDVVGAGGFLAIRRLRVKNRHADGSESREYLVDFMIRPKGVDAVVVAVFSRRDGRARVLVREGLRPPLSVGRPIERLPIPDPRSYLFVRELVAGIIEDGDRGAEGVRRRAAIEVDEESGYRVDPERVFFLGAGTFPSPGALSEKYHLCAVEIDDPDATHPILGDGSPYEEGATTRWMDLDDAIAACVAGEIEDAKTELALRRLRDFLAAPGAPASKSW